MGVIINRRRVIVNSITKEIVGEELKGTFGFVPNIYISHSGKEESYGGWKSTDYIDVSKYMAVYANPRCCDYAGFYNENKEYISSYNAFVPSRAKYVRFSGNNGEMSATNVIGIFKVEG